MRWWAGCDIFRIRTVLRIPLRSHPRRAFHGIERDRMSVLGMTDYSGRCARKAQGCNENTKFRPVISDWTCYKNYEPCPKDSQVGWCNKCWCNKGYLSQLNTAN